MATDMSGKKMYDCEPAPVKHLDRWVQDIYMGQFRGIDLRACVEEDSPKNIDWKRLRHIRVFGDDDKRYLENFENHGFSRGFYLNAEGTWLLLILPEKPHLGEYFSRCSGNAESLWICNSQMYSRDVGKLPGLKTLYFLDNPLMDSVERLDKLTELNKLSISNCPRLIDLSGLGKLTTLTELEITGCNNLTALPGLEKLTGLTRLCLSGCPNLKSLPRLEKLTGLTNLSIIWCGGIVTLPGLENLTRLTQLCLFECSGLTALPGLEKLTGLTELDLSGCSGLTALPGLENLTQLTELDLSGCSGLTALPGLENLTQLTQLDLTGCSVITALPGLEKLTGLTELDLSGCSGLTALPGLKKLTGLTELDLSGCSGLTALPGLEKLTGLTTLNLSGCSGLTVLPGLEKLTGLTTLNLSGCSGLTAIPDGICQMQALRRLDLWHMKLTELPDWLPEIAEKFALGLNFSDGKEKAVVSLFNTTVEGVDMSIFEQPYEMVVEWFKNRHAGTSRPLNEIKVVFLGDGEAGKSLTIARLRNKGGEPKGYVDVRTPGIVIDDVQYPVGDREATLHLWDFGGQEILHSMHRIFLTQRTIYVVVVDGRIGNQDERARYWLHNIQSFAKDAPVLLVLNKLDDGLQADVNATDLMYKYKGLKRIIKLSALKDTQERFNESFTDVLREEIGKTGFLDITWPTIWFNVKKELEKKGTEYVMDGKRYQQICQDNGVEQNRKELLHWFNDLGVSFCCYDDYKLDNYVILKPDWITNALYIILFNEREGARGGLVPHETIYRMLSPDAPNRDKIERVLSGVYYENNDVAYVLEVIRKFQLSFCKDGDYEFIPMLADRNAKNVALEYEQAADALEFHMEFDYLPNNVLHRLMVDCRNDLDMDNVWLTGARFEQRGTGLSAVVVIDGNVMKFLIRQKDNMHRPNTYLAILKSSVDRIWRDMGLQEPKCQLIYKVNDTQEIFDYQLLKEMLDARETEIFSRKVRRKIAIDAIMNQAAPENLLAETKLLDAIIRSCRNIQAEPSYGSTGDSSGKEDLRNRRLRDDLKLRLENTGYHISDQPQRGRSGTGQSVGELDLFLEDDKGAPWTIIEALRIHDGSKTDWNDHLTKLLGGYNYPGLNFAYLLTYVDANEADFMKIWENYRRYIGAYCPGEYTVEANSYKELNTSQDLQYIQKAVCHYSCGTAKVAVYHLFVMVKPQPPKSSPEPKKS